MNRKFETHILMRMIYLIAFISLLTFGTCCFQTYMSYKYFQRDFNLNINLNKVNLNKAGIKELQTLSGIGEGVANKIIQGRPYNHVGEIYERGYVGIKTYNNIKNKIDV